jgi:dihydroorotate dehydrogenase (fumarate)
MLITQLAGHSLSSYIYNASGINNQVLPQLKKIADSDSGAITLKSTSVKEWKGNDTPNYLVKSKLIPGCTLNCMGIPNIGIDATIDMLRELREYSSKTIIADIFSLGGLQDYYDMMDKLDENKGLFNILEINVSCPNIPGKPLLAYDLDSLEELCKNIQKYEFKKGLKLPPYFDMSQFDRVSKIVMDYGIDFISCSNTIGNCLVINPETETTAIKPKNGMGGLGGDWVKPLALGNVWNFYQRLQGKVQIVGVGGVRTGTDAFEFMLAGANAVQIGTTLAQEGAGAFTRIAGELDGIMAEHGYAEVTSAVGKLKVIE